MWAIEYKIGMRNQQYIRQLLTEIEHYRLTLENPFTVRVLSHIPGKDAKLM